MNKIGLIAGSGDLPNNIIDYCNDNKVDIYVVLLKDFANKKNYNCKNYIKTGIGRVGKIIRFFRKNKITDIVFAGGIKRPSLSSIFVDFKGFFLLKRILKNNKLGDNSVSEIIVEFLEKNGINVLQVDDILKDCKINKGFNTSLKFDKEYLEDIRLGKELLERLSDFDVGQSVVVQQKNIIGIEGAEGTANLIKRCGSIKYKKGRKPILIKIKKIGQTNKIDLPSIGPNTIEQLHKNGFAGLVLDNQNCIIINKYNTLKVSEKMGIFVFGV